MKPLTRWAFLILFALLSAMGAAHAQTPPSPETSFENLPDRYFTKQMLDDEVWSDLKLFPSINPKSRPETDPSDPNIHLLSLPWYLHKLQVAQLVGGMIQYRLFGIFHRHSPYYAKMMERLENRTPIKFNYLKIHADRYEPRIENGFTFINSKYEFKGISDKAIGYCYGVTSIFKKFTQLAFFSENIVAEDEVPEKGSDEWHEYYIERLAQVLRGEAAFFPGFKHLRELTMVPEFEFFLKVKLTKEWKRVATLKSTLRSYLHNTREMDAEEVALLLANLKKRLKRGELPKILFASTITKKFMTGGARTHAVPVIKVEEFPEQKMARIHVWDINFYAEDLIKRPYFIDIRYDDEGTPTIRYAEWANPSHDTKKSLLRTEVPGDRIGTVLLAGENNEEVVTTIDTLEEFCTNPPAGHPEIAAECARAQTTDEL